MRSNKLRRLQCVLMRLYFFKGLWNYWKYHQSSIKTKYLKVMYFLIIEHWSWFVSIISQILNDILGSSYSFSSIIFLNNIVYLTLFIQVSCFRDLNKISWIYHQINIIWNFLAKCGFLTGCLGNSFISWLNAILREFWVSIFQKILNGWWQIYERPYSVA